ncbi:MAG: exodeoxyribonuclease V subunit alpha, partial [Rhodanobacter sp.]
SALLAAAARAAIRAEGLGHSCAWLTDPQTDAGFDHDALAALREHDWVGDGSRATPFVLDAQNRFYLWRNWQNEATLAESIVQRCDLHTLPVCAELLARDLDMLFAGMPGGPANLQRAAVAAVPGKRFFVLTGGPGTGKTTTVVRMLLMLLRHAEACGLSSRPSIALAAPTGKAAQRLVQAVARGKAGLQASWAGRGDEPAFQQLLPLIPQSDVRTLHRLLGYRPTDNCFSRGPHNPLAEDIVVVDEASMVDLAMMRQLLQALRPDSVLILLGDPDQLASVDAGSVLADIVACASTHELSSAQTSPSALADHVVTLVHGWRAGSGLQRGIEALRHASDDRWLDALLADRADGDLHVRDAAGSNDLRVNIDAWIERQHATLQVLLSPGVDAGVALANLRRFQILCALRDGPHGAQGINALLARRLALRFEIDTSHGWYHGRPVIVTRNDYARSLFNGDVGIALQDKSGLRVWFELSDRDGNASLRSFSPRTLPAHESAWAITIHRSQGSEYQDVAVVLPPDKDNRVLTRELVYTAISRAHSHAELWTTDGSLRAALAHRVQRQGGLRERLRGTC